MNTADKAVKNSLQFETKKDGLSQQQSGEWKLNLKVHPNEVPAPLLTARMGTRYMAVLVELNDDEMPVEQPQPDKKEDPHRLSRQAAMLCDKPSFRTFLCERNSVPDDNTPISSTWAAGLVRHECKVQSRSEFDTDPAAGARWRELKSKFEEWRLCVD